MYSTKTREITLMSMLLALLMVTAKVVIPLPLLDYLSLQIITVFLIYPVLGCKNGVIVTSSYLFLGLIGLPVFASGGGFAYIFKPTFGFLLAYTLLPWVQSLLTRGISAKIKPTFARLLMINYLSLLFIHLVGIFYKVMILWGTMQNTEAFYSLLTVSTLIDVSCDSFLVFIASFITYKLKSFLMPYLSA